MGIQPQAIVRLQDLKLTQPGAEGQLVRQAPGREQILQLPLARLVGARGKGGRLGQPAGGCLGGLPGTVRGQGSLMVPGSSREILTGRLTEGIKEGRIKFVTGHRLQTQLTRDEKVEELLSIDQFNGWYPIAAGLPLGIRRKGARRQDDALVGTPLHGAPKVADMG